MYSYIYILAEQNNPKFKIGKSKNPLERIKNLQTGNPDKIFIVRLYYIKNVTIIENNLLNYFRKDGYDIKSTDGGTEWFDVMYPDLFLSHCDQFIATNGNPYNWSIGDLED